MARFPRLKVLNTMIETGMVPVFYDPSVEVSRNVAAACMEGGCPLLEFTNRGDHAWEVFSELERYCARELPQLILGDNPQPLRQVSKPLDLHSGAWTRDKTDLIVCFDLPKGNSHLYVR